VKGLNGSSPEIKSARRRIINQDGKGWMFSILRWCREVECDNPAERCLLFTLATYSNKFGECWPSVETLAAVMGRTDRQVQRLLRGLERRGHIAITLGGKGPKDPNVYLLNAWGANELRVTSETERVTSMSAMGDTDVGLRVTPTSPIRVTSMSPEESISKSPCKSPLKSPNKLEDPLRGVSGGFSREETAEDNHRSQSSEHKPDASPGRSPKRVPVGNEVVLPSGEVW
jgi:hypothetical protein